MNNPAAAVAWAEARFERFHAAQVELDHLLRAQRRRRRRHTRANGNVVYPAHLLTVAERKRRNALRLTMANLVSWDSVAFRPMFELVDDLHGDGAARWPTPHPDEELGD